MELTVVCINAWGGRLLGPLLSYIETQDADIYCIQEVFDSQVQWEDQEYCPNLLSRLKQLLPDYVCFSTPNCDNYFFERVPQHDVTFGSVIFIRKSITTGQFKEEFIFLNRHGPPFIKWGVDHPRALQMLELPDAGLWLFHYQGLVTGSPFKGDSEKLLAQSARLRELMHEKQVMLVGDLNITADCQSMRMLDEGMRNLVLEHGYTTTRNKYWKFEDGYSDYIIVPNNVNVKEFSVDEVEISDHLPLRVVLDL